jgi:hypothetical protein
MQTISVEFKQASLQATKELQKQLQVIGNQADTQTESIAQS